MKTKKKTRALMGVAAVKKELAQNIEVLTTAEIEKHDGEDSFQHYIDFARDLERQLRLCRRHLKWVSRCATMAGPAGTKPVFIAEDRMQEIKNLVERMERDGQIPLE